MDFQWSQPYSSLGKTDNVKFDIRIGFSSRMVTQTVSCYLLPVSYQVKAISILNSYNV